LLDLGPDLGYSPGLVLAGTAQVMIQGSLLIVHGVLIDVPVNLFQFL